MDEGEDEPVPEPTKTAAGEIKAIAKDTVHRICSGQVVLSLAVAVKELVENAIDAGATNVEVRLREQGLEEVEVIDNGCGVKQHNLEAMTAKYHTSKLRDFSDLLSVDTFGFRGEALSSLCALANMTIVTRHKDSDVATRINLDHEGNITKRCQCARAIGTTVILNGLFVTLPVRKREFVRNIRREFTKMCNIIQAYCLVAVNTRILCTNQNAKGVKSVIMQTHGASDVLANIGAIFGSKQSTDIVPLREIPLNTNPSDDPDDDVDGLEISKEEMDLLNDRPFELEGFVSHCNQGAGRSAKDRQFFYINSRPCEPKNICKLMNDVYRRYNMQQVPFIYLNVKVSRKEVDINLTPDKRQLLINNEKILLLAIKRSLINTFEQLRPSYKTQNNTIINMLEKKANNEDNVVIEEEKMSNTDDNLEPLVPISTSQNFINVLSQWKRTGDTRGKAPPVKNLTKRRQSNEVRPCFPKMAKVEDFLLLEATEDRRYKYVTDSEDEEEEENEGEESEVEEEEEENQVVESEEEVFEETKDIAETKMDVEEEKFSSSTEESNVPPKSRFEPFTVKSILGKRTDCKVFTEPISNFIENSCVSETQSIEKFPLSKDKPHTSIVPDEKEEIKSSALLNKPTQMESIPSPVRSENSSSSEDNIVDAETTIHYDDSEDNNDDASQDYQFSCDELATSLAEIESGLQEESAYEMERENDKYTERMRFKSQISPSQNKDAENELTMEISKHNFAEMEIIGQFNLGFIIVKLDEDLFIVDQHASDEKYNFEQLQLTTVLQTQPLAAPQTLQLTAVNELVLLDHLAVFEKNGFKIEVKENADPGRRIRLLGKPFSKNWEFGQEDIDELIFMLHDAPKGTICRPSRIRGMFASRACRKSIMIGEALSIAKMRKVIDHMGQMDLPWNCPHGRPTMRHLINAEMLTEDEHNEQNTKMEIKED